jgi:hypothetical protein
MTRSRRRLEFDLFAFALRHDRILFLLRFRWP